MASSEYQSYYAIIRTIPSGRVMTYGDVAAHAGRRRHARRVGYALHALNEANVPWWRVVNAKGGISLRAPDGEADDRQRELLRLEDVEFDLEGRLDLAQYRFHPDAESADALVREFEEK